MSHLLGVVRHDPDERNCSIVTKGRHHDGTCSRDRWHRDYRQPRSTHATNSRQELRVLTRNPGENRPGITHVQANTVTGEGLAKALDGIEVVLHLAGGAKGDDTAAQNLTGAAKAAGVKHLILISVTGADTMPIGYFHAKATAEQIIAASGVPYTIIRAAQLHDFVLPVIRAMGRLPLLPEPGGLRFEPVAVDEVARRLCEVTLGDPAGRVADIVGPEVLTVRELADVFYEQTRRRRRLGLPMRIPGKVGPRLPRWRQPRRR
jgi:uncharacterized protein YbjT (DUF2867 family)